MFDIIYRYDPSQANRRRNPEDAAEALRSLEEGNRLFASLTTGGEGGCRIVPIDLEDMGIGAKGEILRQQPFAVVLGCADARVPTELIFERSCNELYVVRVAGNILGQEQSGSIDYAVGHLGSSLKVIVVLGHSQCGAVTAAVETKQVGEGCLLKSTVNLFAHLPVQSRSPQAHHRALIAELPGSSSIVYQV